MTGKVLIPVVIFMICVLGCRFFSGSSSKELVYAPTEVGTPVGDKIAKDIGPEGGAVSTPDGRMTLTVPQSAVEGPVNFSITPITNKAGNGLGNAYRLEPNGMTFATPLDLSIRYVDEELEGTAAEALAIAFQDKDGAWHVLDQTRLDDANKSVTFSITHFTDFSFLARMRLEPSRATLRVGETMQIRLIGCEPTDWRRPYDCRAGGPNDPHYIQLEWYTDIGTITNGINPAIYTAPPRKPRPNVATVSLPFFAAQPPNRPVVPGETFPTRRGMFTAHITSIDRGYRATGGSDGISWSGIICDLEKPFDLVGQARLLTFDFKLTPSA